MDFQTLRQALRLGELGFLRPLGETAIFYAPAHKLDDPKYGRDGLTPNELFKAFFLEKFGGLTHEISSIQGQWMGPGGERVLTDQHQRFEVSFDGEAQTIQFLKFLAEMCGLLDEQSIYLTMGGRSWLVERQ
jgi:hypothetical protein